MPYDLGDSFLRPTSTFFFGHQTSSASFLVAMSSAVFPQRPTEEELFVGPGISLSGF